MNMYVQITLLAFLAKMFWLDCVRHMRCVVSYDTLLSFFGHLDDFVVCLHVPVAPVTFFFFFFTINW